MSNNLISKRIDNYFEKLTKHNNTPKSGGGIYESFIKPNALMIFLLILVSLFQESLVFLLIPNIFLLNFSC